MDRNQFKTIFLPLHPLLYRIALNMLGNSADAEDAVQETYLKLCRLDTETGKWENPRGYCIRILQHICSDSLRRGRDNIFRNSTGTSEAEKREESITPEKQLTEKESTEIVRKCLLTLPENHRIIVILRDIEQLEISEIEKITGLSSVNVRVMLSRGRKTLREKIKKYIYG